MIGIGGRLRASQHRVIAGAFRFERELAPRHPDQRMEPIHGAHGPRQAVAHPVAAPHVFQFMHDRAIQVLHLPGLRVLRQHDGGMHHAAGHRPRQRFVQQHFDAPTNAGLERQAFDDRLPMPPRQSGSAQRANLPQTHRHRQQKERHPGDPSREQESRQRKSRRSRSCRRDANVWRATARPAESLGGLPRRQARSVLRASALRCGRGGASREAIGSTSSTANAAAISAWRTAARLLRASHAPIRANATMTVALATSDAGSELLSASITPLMTGIMTASSFPCEHGRFRL